MMTRPEFNRGMSEQRQAVQQAALDRAQAIAGGPGELASLMSFAREHVSPEQMERYEAQLRNPNRAELVINKLRAGQRIERLQTHAHIRVMAKNDPDPTVRAAALKHLREKQRLRG